MSKHTNFDNFFKEQRVEQISFTMFGEDYFLPSSMPAAFMVELLRGQKDDELSVESVFRMMSTLLGNKNFDRLVDNGLTVDQMEHIIEWVAEQYGATPNKGNEEGNFTQEK
jgi:hypothetical protein